MVVKLLILIIRVYQWTLSPLLGRVCRFEPSCSRYAVSCLQGQGAIQGTWLALKRLVRCHPFNPGGYDPPPPPRHAPFSPDGSPRETSDPSSLPCAGQCLDGCGL